MRTLFSLVCLILATLPASAANFPYIRLNGKTNTISDNGTALTRDGVPIGAGGSSLWTTNTFPSISGTPFLTPSSSNGVMTTDQDIVINTTAQPGAPYEQATFRFTDPLFSLHPLTSHFFGSSNTVHAMETVGFGLGGVFLDTTGTNTANANGAVVTWQATDQNTNVVPNTAIFAFHGNNVTDALSALTNEVIFMVDNDWAGIYGITPIISVANRSGAANLGWGAFGVNIAVPESTFEVISYETNRVASLIQGATDQVADLQQWRDSSSNIVASVSKSGAISANSITSTGENQLYRGNSDGVSIGNSAGALVGTNNDVNVGFFAGYQATNSGFATRVGRHAGYDAYSAPSATFIGHAAGQYAHGADSTVAVGYLAGRYNETSDHATFLGPSAGQFATNAQGAVMVGYSAGENSATGDHSVLIGANAGQNSTVNPNSVMIGRWAGLNAANASQSVYIGAFAAENFSRHHSLVIDSQTGYAETGTNALIYGEFDNRTLYLNAQVHMTNIYMGTNILSFNGTNLTWNGTAITVP